MATTFAVSSQALQDTLGILDTEEYSRALGALCAARRILFCGFGESSPVASLAAARFARLGVDSRAPADLSAQIAAAALLGPGDVLFALCRTGRSSTVVKAAKLACARGATVVVVTNYPFSALAKQAGVLLRTADFAEHSPDQPLCGVLSQYCLLESLYANLVKARGEDIIPALRSADNAAAEYEL